MKYKPTPTGQRFHADDTSQVRMLMSAVGQGKTVTAFQDLGMRAIQQAPDQHGVRRTRFLVIRSTFGELKSTTIKTFQRWFPPTICPLVFDSPIRGHMKMIPLADGTYLDCEFIFLPLNRPDDVSKVLGIEFTAAYINEVAELDDPDIFKNLMMRIPRYPDKADGAACTWSGIICDCNPPPIGSWLHELFEIKRPQGYTVYRYQPPLLIHRDPEDPDDVSKITIEPNPDGENVSNVQGGYKYWIDMAKNNLDDNNFIKRFVLGEYPYSAGGKPVYPQFSETRHIREFIQPDRGAMLLVGVDFGFNPAAAICQVHGTELVILDEIITEDTTLEEFTEDMLLPLLRTKYHGYKVLLCGDPSGETSGSTIDRTTSFMYLKSKGLKIYKPKTNLFKPRRESVIYFLVRLGGFGISKQASGMIAGFSGGYKMKQSASASTASLRPEKNLHSHVHDGFQAVTLYVRDGGDTSSHYSNYNNFDYIVDDVSSRRSNPKEFLYA